MKRLFIWLIAATLLVNCTAPRERIPPIESMQQSSDKIIVYQIMTRLFGNKVNTNKSYGTIDENGVGKFNDINDAALKGIKQLGVSHVWYTGVIEHALLTDYTQYGIPLDDADVVKGRAGSPYSIKDYYDVNPDLAVNVPQRMREFEQLIERTHANDLKAIIDFVPNHVARAYKSDAKPQGVKDLGETDDNAVAFHPNNNFYYIPGQSFQPPRGYNPLGYQNFPTKDGKFEEIPAKVTGNDQFTATPGVNDWFEAVKLNYGVDIQNGRTMHFDPVPDTWNKMRDILVFWANKKVDGFRCDMAEMVPVEFWGWVIPQVREVNPEIIFIAEIYNADQYTNYIRKGGFDYLYDKVLLYDTLRLLLNGDRNTSDITAVQDRLKDINHHMLHFIENHDEQRVASRFFAGDIWKAAPAMVVSATIDRGPVMIYFGQEVGEPGAGSAGFQNNDGRTTIYDYWGVPEHQKWMNEGKFDGGQLSLEQKQLRQFYADLLTLAGNNPAFISGQYLDLTYHNINLKNFSDKIHAFIRFNDQEKFLILTSFNEKNETIKVQIPENVAEAMGMDRQQLYIARDMLWKEAEVGFDQDHTFQITLKPFSSYIFKIK